MLTGTQHRREAATLHGNYSTAGKLQHRMGATVPQGSCNTAWNYSAAGKLQHRMGWKFMTWLKDGTNPFPIT